MKISIHALHKTGSMFLYNFFKEVSQIKNITYLSINDIDVIHDEIEILKELDNKFNEMNNVCYCPNRLFPNKLKDNVKYIFLFRDPLDTLVSEYYSWGWIHHIDDENKFIMINSEKRKKVQTLTIDEYCLQFSNNLLERLSMGLKHKNHESVIFVSYEEMVLNFKNWLNKAVKNFNLSDSEKETLYINFKHEFENVEETLPDDIKQGVNNHKRKMYPNDHLEKLKPKTIKVLKDKFKNFYS